MATVTSSEYVLFQVLPQPILNFLCMMMIRKSLGTRNCHGSLVLWSKRLHRMEGRPAPIQNGSLIGQLARLNRNFSWKFPIPMRLNFIVQYGQATFWTLFVSLLYFVRIFHVIRTGVVCPSLMYEVKSTSESPPSTTAISASNRKDRLYRVFRVYRLYRLYKVYRVYRERLLQPSADLASYTHRTNFLHHNSICFKNKVNF